MQYDKNADIIANLPTNKIDPSHNELQIIDKIFDQQIKDNNLLYKEVKELIIIFILFYILSQPYIINLINVWNPIKTQSSYLTICLQALAMVTLYWLLNNINLSRQN
jgi:hypothetical protein